jgi:hypothetical protein
MTRLRITDVPLADSTRPSRAGHKRGHANRLTVAGAITLLLISLLHAAAFAPHRWWGEWLAGPTRRHGLPADALVQFWGSLGGFVVPGVLLALLILRAGRRGRTAPAYVGVVLGLWALSCAWVVGPSGFLLLLIPAVLIIVAAVRSTRSARLRTTPDPDRSEMDRRDQMIR